MRMTTRPNSTTDAATVTIRSRSPRRSSLRKMHTGAISDAPVSRLRRSGVSLASRSLASTLVDGSSILAIEGCSAAVPHSSW